MEFDGVEHDPVPAQNVDIYAGKALYYARFKRVDMFSKRNESPLFSMPTRPSTITGSELCTSWSLSFLTIPIVVVVP
jgi:hypothetical protein